MSLHQPYRPLALLLAMVFCVFNIGIPVVLATCPMADMSKPGACPLCARASDTRGESVSRYIDTSCCAVRIAAEGNTTEFLQGKQQVDHTLAAGEVVTASALPALSSNTTPLIHLSSSSPPGMQDIPVLVCSFRI